MKKLVFLFSTLLTAISSFAQQGCPDVEAGADVTLNCQQNCTNLSANVFSAYNTTSYSVSSISYQPLNYASGTQVLLGIDDVWSDPINLPFTFCFYGQQYNQVVIGSNGLISFDNTLQAGDYCDWNNTDDVPAEILYNNVIMGPYHDIDPSVFTASANDIRYEVIGTYPCRIFKVSYYQIPMYQCNNLIATHQIVMYETTNAIEVYIQNKPICSSWNEGGAIVGIVGSNSNQWSVAPGRNFNNQWTGTNEAWRFTPNGAPIFDVAWYLGGAQVGTGTSYQACHSTGGSYQYIAEANYSTCFGTLVTVYDTVNVTKVSDFSLNNPVIVNTNCNQSTGSISVSTSVPGSYTYAWSNGDNTSTISSLPAGSYSVTVTDANLCEVQATYSVVNSNGVNIDSATVTPAACFGVNNGSISVFASGGSNIQYNWSNAATSSSLTNIPPGSYDVTVTDANNCSSFGSYQVAALTTINFNAPIISPPSCNGGNNGTITVSTSGGNGSINYGWSNFLNGSTLTNLAAGSYTVTASDQDGCSATSSYNITQPSPIQVNSSNITDATCNTSNGAISINASGGNGSLSYSWSNGSNASTLNSLSAGNYSVTITDASLCSVVNSFTVQVSNGPNLDSVSIQGLTCNTAPNAASIHVYASGNNLVYFWSNSVNTALNSGLTSGNYSVTISDVNNCSMLLSYTIASPSLAPLIGQATINNINCAGAANGSVISNVSGGTGTLLYNWSNAQQSPNISNLAAGTYGLTVSDAAGCSSTATYSITEPSAISIASSSTSNPDCFNSTDGSINVNAGGGTGTLNYNWSNNQQTASISGLADGTYILTVSDANNCSITATFTLTEPTELTATITPNGLSCFGDQSGFITIVTTGGTPQYNIQSSLDGVNFTPNLTDLTAGNYSIRISDANGCLFTSSTTISTPAENLYSTSSSAVTCFNAQNADGSLTVNALTSSNSPFSFALDGGSSQQNGLFSNLSGGNYEVIVTDNNGCVDTITETVAAAQPFSVDVTPDSIIVAPGQSVQLVADVSANGNNLVYSWSPIDGLSCSDCLNPTATPIGQQTYVLSVSLDGNPNCFVTEDAVIFNNANYTLPDAFSPNGDGNNDFFFPVLGSGELVKVREFRVYNRWGEMIHSENTPWDGSYKGKKQPVETYQYFAILEKPDVQNPGKTITEKIYGPVNIVY